MAEIILRHLVKRYGDGFTAVNDVSLEIRDGEFMILVGPSGCGKSTLLRMIVGLEDITSGELTIGGELVNDKAPRDRNLAMVFQNYALYPHLTVYENIAFPLRLRLGRRSRAEIDAKVQQASALLELGEQLRRKPAHLSGGQRQRVAMGRALVRDAQAFLFDEPLSNLDAKLRGQMRTEIARIQRGLGTTTVYVTHDQTEAMTLGDRVAVLRKGVLQQCGSPRELYEQPVNLFVAGFIGSPPMNLLPARNDGASLRLPVGQVPLPERVRGLIRGCDPVIVGIRPEHMEDATRRTLRSATTGVEIEVEVDVTEWLGSGLFAYVPYEAEAEVRSRLQELDRDLDGEALRSQLVVSLDPKSRIRDGDRARLWFDPDTMHVFDPDSGRNLTRDDAAAERINQDDDALRHMRRR